MAATATGWNCIIPKAKRRVRSAFCILFEVRNRVDMHFPAPYTTSLMAKTDLASGPRAGRDSTGRRSWLYWSIAALVLLAGFADLARGGETLAPILLVIGYCVLVPLAILR